MIVEELEGLASFKALRSQSCRKSWFSSKAKRRPGRPAKANEGQRRPTKARIVLSASEVAFRQKIVVLSASDVELSASRTPLQYIAV